MTSLRYVPYAPYVACVALDGNPALGSNMSAIATMIRFSLKLKLSPSAPNAEFDETKFKPARKNAETSLVLAHPVLRYEKLNVR